MSTRPSEKSLIEVRRALQSIAMRLDALEALDVMLTSGAGGGGRVLMESGALVMGTESGETTEQEFLTMMEELKRLLWSLGGVDTGYIVLEGGAGDPGFWDLLALTGVTVGGSGSGLAADLPLAYEDGELVYFTLGGWLDQVENRLVAGGL
jgi:hypothetical protein